MRIISRVGIGKDPGSVYHLDVSGSSNFDSQVFFQNTAFFNAGVELGDTTADLISVNGRIDTNVEPSTTLSRNFGSSSLFWSNTYTQNLVIKNAGSVESDGAIINIGTVSATTINIGNNNSTVNIFGIFNKIQSTDLQVFDKLFTVNKNGTASSASGAGFEIEENNVIVSYVKTSSNRNEWLLKTPNKSGIISLEPGSSAFTHKILSQASADRVWTLPDNTDIFVGTNNSQTINNKTLNNTIVTGTFTISGTAVGVGFIPVGGIIALASNLSGAYVCSATTVADSYGFVLCGFNGQSGNQIINDATSPLNGQSIPRINNDVFLMGNVTAGSTGGTNITTLSTANIPSHNHTITHGHSQSGSSAFNARHSHATDDSLPQRKANSFHRHRWRQQFQEARGGGGFWGAGFASNSGLGSDLNTMSAVEGEGGLYDHGYVNTDHDHDLTTYWQQYSDGGDLNHAHTTYTTDMSGNSGNTGSTSSYDSRPKYISTVYVMRIK